MPLVSLQEDGGKCKGTMSGNVLVKDKTVRQKYTVLYKSVSPKGKEETDTEGGFNM